MHSTFKPVLIAKKHVLLIQNPITMLTRHINKTIKNTIKINKYFYIDIFQFIYYILQNNISKENKCLSKSENITVMGTTK